jgi:hypothetical protein
MVWMSTQALFAVELCFSSGGREDQAVVACLELQTCVCIVEADATTTSLPATSL